jgi:hypothetical protein
MGKTKWIFLLVVLQVVVFWEREAAIITFSKVIE